MCPSLLPLVVGRMRTPPPHLLFYVMETIGSRSFSCGLRPVILPSNILLRIKQLWRIRCPIYLIFLSIMLLDLFSLLFLLELFRCDFCSVSNWSLSSFSITTSPLLVDSSYIFVSLFMSHIQNIRHFIQKF